MPFTGSHVAAVLPLARAPLVASALAIGSMAPDIPYYAPSLIDPKTTHSAVGVIGVDVMLGLAAYLLWHALLVRPAIAGAPAGLRERIPARLVVGLHARLSGPRVLLLTYVSLAVGAATHVVWDSFTHPDRWGSDRLAWLMEQHGPLPGYRWAQYASGLVGALVIALWLARWWRSTEPGTAAPGLRPAMATWAWMLICASGVTGAILGSTGRLSSNHDPEIRRAAYFAASRGIAAAVAVAVLLAAGWHLASRQRPASGAKRADG